MSWYEGGLIALLALGAAMGAWAGLTRQLSAYASIVLGVMFGLPLSALAAARLKIDGELGRALVFIGCYALIALACYGVGAIVRRLMKKADMRGYDRHVGALIGAAEGFVLAVVVALVVANIDSRAADEMRARPAGQVAMRAVTGLRDILPTDIHQALEPYLQPLELPRRPGEGG